MKAAKIVSMDDPKHSSGVPITEAVMPEESPSTAGALKTLHDLSRLSDNWDGFGSPPLTPVALASAAKLLRTVALEAVPPPYIGPVTGGGIQIEWYTPGRELEVEILPDGSVEYVTVDETGQSNDGVLPSVDDGRVQELVRWLVPRTTDTEPD